eukprot:1192141-Prorocentrum_minimum.AAC.1
MAINNRLTKFNNYAAQYPTCAQHIPIVPVGLDLPICYDNLTRIPLLENSRPNRWPRFDTLLPSLVHYVLERADPALCRRNKRRLFERAARSTCSRRGTPAIRSLLNPGVAHHRRGRLLSIPRPSDRPAPLQIDRWASAARWFDIVLDIVLDNCPVPDRLRVNPPRVDAVAGRRDSASVLRV